MHSISHQSTVCTVKSTVKHSMHSQVHSLYYVYLYLITCFAIPSTWLATGVDPSLLFQSLQFRMLSETFITKYSNQNLASSCTMIEPQIWDVRYRKFSKNLMKDNKNSMTWYLGPFLLFLACFLHCLARLCLALSDLTQPFSLLHSNTNLPPFQRAEGSTHSPKCEAGEGHTLSPKLVDGESKSDIRGELFPHEHEAQEWRWGWWWAL